jgi:hypothetical protein
VQFVGPALDRVERKLQESLNVLGRVPEVNDFVVVQILGKENTVAAFRAQVREISAGAPKAVVELIDFAQESEVDKNFFEWPGEFDDPPPLARKVSLGFLQLVDGSEQAISKVWQVCRDGVLYVHSAYEEQGKPFVFVTADRELDSGSLNAFLVANGIAKYRAHTAPPRFATVVDTLKAV